MQQKEYFWQNDEFEDYVSRVLIGCYETKVLKNRGNAPNDRLNDERLNLVRRSGPYIASSSRIVVVPEPTDGGRRQSGDWSFDVLNDPLPSRGCVAYAATGEDAKAGQYLWVVYFRRADALGKGWSKRSGGHLYEMFFVIYGNDGVVGDRSFLTVDKAGRVWACDKTVMGRSGPVRLSSHDEANLINIEGHFCLALQSVSDRRFSWSIDAFEGFARVIMGCMQEEVKSLLYARSLPMTATGRKRPVLHLVEAHRRRLKNGTDIDVTSFLRGQQAVEIGGTVFKVNPAPVLRPSVSKASQNRYFDALIVT